MCSYGRYQADAEKEKILPDQGNVFFYENQEKMVVASDNYNAYTGRFYHHSGPKFCTLAIYLCLILKNGDLREISQANRLSSRPPSPRRAVEDAGAACAAFRAVALSGEVVRAEHIPVALDQYLPAAVAEGAATR